MHHLAFLFEMFEKKENTLYKIHEKTLFFKKNMLYFYMSFVVMKNNENNNDFNNITAWRGIHGKSVSRCIGIYQ